MAEQNPQFSFNIGVSRTSDIPRQRISHKFVNHPSHLERGIGRDTVKRTINTKKATVALKLDDVSSGRTVESINRHCLYRKFRGLVIFYNGGS